MNKKGCVSQAYKKDIFVTSFLLSLFFYSLAVLSLVVYVKLIYVSRKTELS